MLGSLVAVLKNFIKCSLDNYVLPGTVTGSEILWLYMVQWKRDLVLLISASFVFVVSHYDMPGLERALSQYRSSSRHSD